MISYLKWKNKFFRKFLRRMLKEKDYENIIYLVGNEIQFEIYDYSEYFDSTEEPYFFDLLMIVSDEEGYKRQIFCPVPLLSKRTIKKIQKLLENGTLKVVSRQWHDKYKNYPVEISEFYPPSSFEEEECYPPSEEEGD
jgi:hypothetical protein